MSADVVAGLDFAAYVEIGAEHATSLRDMLTSPLLYKHRKDSPRPDSDTLRTGRLSHTAVYEPDLLPLKYAVWPAVDRDGKKQIRRGEKWEQFCAANAGRTIVTEEQYQTAIRLRNAVRRHAVARAYLNEANGRAELSVTWTHARTGLKIKNRFDWLCSVLTDLKSTRDVSPGAFSSACMRYGYAMSMALYHDGAVEMGAGPLPVKLIAAQKDEPNDVAVFDVPPPVLTVGRAQYEYALTRVVECREANEWPGQAPGELTLSLPDWVDPGIATYEATEEAWPWENNT